jgi:glucokinase
MNEFLERLNALIAIVGAGMTLGEAMTWLEVKENAERLRAEGHETDIPTDEEVPNAE